MTTGVYKCVVVAYVLFTDLTSVIKKLKFGFYLVVSNHMNVSHLFDTQ